MFEVFVLKQIKWSSVIVMFNSQNNLLSKQSITKCTYRRTYHFPKDGKEDNLLLYAAEAYQITLEHLRNHYVYHYYDYDDDYHK